MSAGRFLSFVHTLDAIFDKAMHTCVCWLIFLFGVIFGKADNVATDPLISVVQLLPENESQLLSLIELFETGEVSTLCASLD